MLMSDISSSAPEDQKVRPISYTPHARGDVMDCTARMLDAVLSRSLVIGAVLLNNLSCSLLTNRLCVLG